MTHEVAFLVAVADLQAVRSVESFGANLLALLTHEARLADAQPIGFAAPRVVKALAVVLAVVAPRRVGARNLTVVSGPARQAVTDPVDVRAFPAVLASALVLAVLAVRSLLARMVAGQSDVPGPAFEVARHMVAGRFRRHVLRAALLAVLPVIAGGALLVARPARPAAFAEALAGLRIARRVVLAVALVVTLRPVKAKRAGTFASHARVLDGLRSRVVGLADAAAVDGIARQRLRLLADALEGAVLTEEPRVALLLARFAGPSGAAIALAVHRMATAVVEAVAGLGAAFAVRVDLARPLAFETRPARLAEALAGLGVAIRVVLAVAALRAFGAVGASRAVILALGAGET